MFYLKYRPQKLAEIDNTKVREIMTRILESSRFSHAYLFVGQKGTGKTSTARILAKAINCEKNKFSNKKNSKIEPCNQCLSCQTISRSNSVDVVEMDAASNRGIEEIKKLIHESNFSPMTSRWRIFIIDEAHMITPEAFNALLKTLEEPPPSVMFIFATTERSKLPKTIISRCQVVNFGVASKKDIIRMLRRCLKGEKISNVDDKTLELVATHSDNSFRDAAKILEELIVQKKLKYFEAEKFLGFSRQNFLAVIAKKNAETSLNWIEEFCQNGGSIKILIEQALDQLKNNLLKSVGIDDIEAEKIDLSKKELIILIKLLTDAYQRLRISPIESLPLEIAVLEFYNLLNSRVKS